MGQSRHVDYFLKNLGLILNFIKEGISIKDISKAATDCTAVAAINWQDTRSSDGFSSVRVVRPHQAPPKKRQKVTFSKQDIALFFHSSTMTVVHLKQ